MICLRVSINFARFHKGNPRYSTKPVSAQGFGKNALNELKIPREETPVPVRVRPSAPALSWDWLQGMMALTSILTNCPMFANGVEFALLMALQVWRKILQSSDR